ncbi:MAG: choice-of-anchor L domain-containing protein [Flavobacteriales bacterium]|nr:choice-of-anchor L domain-containing protein [Flavobacteriales bacterium]
MLMAQIPDITYASAIVASNYLAGANVEVANAIHNGHPHELATFTDGTSKIGFETGVALTTGNAAFAATWGTSNSGDAQQTGSSYYDADLDAISPVGFVNNASTLEFDVKTTNVDLAFTFVFASEEYLDYVGSNRNDVFGIFISGPGISGPFSNNAENMAVVGGAPISINTINPLQNANLYVDNLFNNPVGNVLTEATAQWAYDGKTVVLTVHRQVLCNQWYHLKFAICNMVDPLYDSGIFIKSGTLTSEFAPPGPLTVEPVPACEGEPLTLTIEGDASWFYTWSTVPPQSGFGLQQITTTASTSIDSYSVTAEYLPGCFLALDETQGRVLVHMANNLAPICSGGDLYVQADHLLDVTMPSSDSPNEQVDVVSWSGAPGTYGAILGQYEQGHFAWVPSESDIGYHTVQFTFEDNNACGTLQSTCIYNIKVMCRYCPVCVYYENRSPGGLPLPEYTVAGGCIVAGTDVDGAQANGPVDTGEASVTFEAPVITLAPGFTAGLNFTALVNNDACIEDCEGCCDVMDGGISYNLVPNVFTPNGDGVNDYWQVLDELHPFCAYNANFFELTIFSRWNDIDVPVAHRTGAGYCCPFVSRAPGVLVLSSIHWDGRANGSALFSDGSFVPDGIYYYVLDIVSNCGPTDDLAGYIHIFGSPGATGGGEYMALQQQGDAEVINLLMEMELPAMSNVLHGTDKEVQIAYPEGVKVYPNPTTGMLTIQSNRDLRSVEVRDALGRRLILERGVERQMTLDLRALANGGYLMLIEDATGHVHVERIVKQ